VLTILSGLQECKNSLRGSSTSERLGTLHPLPDPRDDLVLEVAAHGRCDRIVTFKTRDFAGSERFGINAETPDAFLRFLGIKP